MASSLDALTTAAAREVGPECVRVATADEGLEGSPPPLIVEPRDPESAAGVLAWASRDRVGLVIRGRGTKLSWGPPMPPVALVLSTARLDTVVDHRHGDLTATVRAGATLAGVNATLGAHRQWIPLDPFRADLATIGGVVATNDSGPRRHRFGTPRDLIIGMTIARSDGRLAKSGGIVVKNVAGYDLARLMTGSFGALALIVDATFKLSPVAPASRTVAIRLPTDAAAGTLLADLAISPTMPSAVEMSVNAQASGGRLAVRFETTGPAADDQATQIVKLASTRGATSEMISGADELALWGQHASRPWSEPGSIVKVSLLPARLMSFVQWLRETVTVEWELVGRAGLGVVLLRLTGPSTGQHDVVTRLRATFKAGETHVSVLRADPDLKSRLGAFGDLGDALPLMQAIKRQFDPAGILSSGNF